MIVAQMIFIGSIGIAFAKAIENRTAKDNWTNIYAYAIALSIVFLHICPILGFNALIGVSQSERQVPEILNTLKRDLDHDPDWVDSRIITPADFPLPLLGVKSRIAKCNPITISQRFTDGGIYCWRPMFDESFSRDFSYHILAVLFVFISIFTANVISWRVPHEGFD
jgi:hypothetical protein